MKRNSFRNNVIKSNESKFKRAFEHGTKAQRTQGHDKRWRRHWVITKRPTQILHASATASNIDNQLSKAIALGNKFSSFGRVSLSDNRHHRCDSTSILFNWTSEKTVEFHSSHDDLCDGQRFSVAYVRLFLQSSSHKLQGIL